MTIKEIAQLAGVSSAAVSRYLNEGYVSEEKREKIKKIIETTGYRPSAQARMLRTKKACLVGVIVPKINSESISRVTAGISQVLSARGYQMLLAITDNYSKKELEYIDLFENYPVDGIILAGTVVSARHKKAFKEAKVPIVVVGQKVREVSCVYHDDYDAAKQMAQYAAKMSQKRLAYIGVSREDKAAGAARTDGFFAGLKAAGRTPDERLYREAKFTMESGYAQAMDLMKKESDIDIISCATDTIAAGAIEAIREYNNDHEANMKVTGFGDNRFLRAVTGGITTVHFAYKTSGIKSAELLLEMIEKGHTVPVQIKLGYEMIKGADQ